MLFTEDAIWVSGRSLENYPFISIMMTVDNEGDYYRNYTTKSLRQTALSTRDTTVIEEEKKVQAQFGHRKTITTSSASLFLVVIHEI